VIDSNLMFLIVRESSASVIHIPNNLFFQKMFRVTGGRDRSLFEEFESDPGFTPATLRRADIVRPGQSAAAQSTQPCDPK